MKNILKTGSKGCLFVEIVKDIDGSYYANVNYNGYTVWGLPEYVTYKELKKAFKEKIGYTLPNLSELPFRSYGRKYYVQFEDYMEFTKPYKFDEIDEDIIV